MLQKISGQGFRFPCNSFGGDDALRRNNHAARYAHDSVRTPQYGGSSDICALLRDRSDESQKALFSGAPLVFFSPVMFFNNFVAAIIAELLMLLFFRGYKNKGSVLFTAGIYMPLSLPISVLFSIWLNGQSYEQLLARPTASIFTSLGTVALGFIGAAIGMKIAAELQKAGKLKPDGEDGNA